MLTEPSRSAPEASRLKEGPQAQRKEAALQSSTDLSGFSAAVLGQMLARREIDAVELTEYFIRRIENHSDQAVFVTTTFERARKEAAESAKRYRRGSPHSALDGVPVAWKDMIDVSGTPTAAGSAIYRHASAASSDAPVVANLAAAGMVTLGKTNLSEFAYSALGLNPHFGTPLNPRARDVPRVPGGSSSGSGVAVGAHLVPVAIGTDTGGSVRVPAAFNGVVGYKTSERRFERTGVFPLSPTLDTVGVFAHQVSDCQLVDLAMRTSRTQLPGSETAPTLKGLTLVAPENVVMDDLQPGVRRNFLASLNQLKDAGADIVWRIVPELDELKALSEAHGFIASAEAYCGHHDLLEGPRRSEIDPFVFRRIMAAREMSAYDLLRLQQGRLRLSQLLWASLGEDLLVMPTVAHVAPPLAPLEADIDLFASVNGKTIRNTMWANMLNMCALAMPNGLGEAQMPTSMAFYAAAGREDYLLDMGRKLSVCVEPGVQ